MYGLIFQSDYIEIFKILTILGVLLKLIKMMIEIYFYSKKSSLEIKSMKLDYKLKKRKLKNK